MAIYDRILIPPEDLAGPTNREVFRPMVKALVCYEISLDDGTTAISHAYVDLEAFDSPSLQALGGRLLSRMMARLNHPQSVSGACVFHSVTRLEG